MMTQQEADPQVRPRFRRSRIVLTLLAIVLLCLSPLEFRAMRLAAVPNISEPFDVREFGTVSIPEPDNAFVLYEQAASSLTPPSAAVSKDLDQATEEGWTAASADVRAWVESNKTSIETYRLGSERPNFLYHQPLDYRVDITLPVTQELRTLARLARLEASRREDAGDVAGAWALYKAMLRSSRHTGMHGCLIERLVGIAIQATAVGPILRWSARSDVDAQLLAQALGDLRASGQMTVPLSVGIKIEYIVLSHALNHPESLAIDDALKGLETPPGRVWMFMNGEPDLSRRVMCLIVANQLSQCDLPAWERAPITMGGAGLFETDGAGASEPGNLPSAAKIKEWTAQTLIARRIVPAIAQAIQAVTRDEAKQAGLEAALAAQLHYREHRRVPDRIEDLEGKYLPQIPRDPFGKSGQSLRYRREDDGAIIWSIGPDGIDNEGLIEFPRPDQSGDLLFKIEVPQPKETSK